MSARRRFRPRRALSSLLSYLVLLLILLFAVFPFLWTLAISLTNKAAPGVSIYDFPASLFPRSLTLYNFFNVFRTFHLARLPEGPAG